MTEKSGSSLALAIRLFLHEGPRALWNRAQDRLEEKDRLRGLPTLREDKGGLSIDFEPPPVLNVSPIPPSPKRGGAQIQLLDRLAEEKKMRTVALAYPRDGIWWLEIWAATNTGVFRLGSAGEEVALVERAAKLAGTSVVHVESLAGLPLNLVEDLEDRNLATVLSIHDFTLFCRRPHLIETATTDFCEYCQDPDRCGACLQDTGPGPFVTQADYRRAGAAAYKKATLAIYPSTFLQRQHQALFPGLRGPGRDVVIAPASLRPAFPVIPSTEQPRIAFVGGVFSHKGGALIAPTMKRLRDHISNAVGYVYGNGDGELLRELRRTTGIHIRGYHRQGKLPEMLERDRISVAVLPSICPESYSLVFDECLSAGVPVIAFGIGAVGDRLVDLGAGRLVPMHLGAGGLADAIVEHLSSGLEVPGDAIASLPTPARAAQLHIGLYDSLATGA